MCKHSFAGFLQRAAVQRNSWSEMLGNISGKRALQSFSCKVNWQPEILLARELAQVFNWKLPGNWEGHSWLLTHF